ncbi:MAG: ATP-dependent DNA helicase RecG [Verrucomicrobia bacterium]|nr:MAG: ATP-dependent DNA helicase RecG [Verrucomicrobiota bacterium]
MAPEPRDPLDWPVTVLRHVGPERAAQLARLGIRTVGDLLRHRPRRYEDRRRVRRIGELEVGETAVVEGRVVAAGVRTFRRGRRSLAEVIIEDGSGRLHCRWWNLPYMAERFAVGQELVVWGKVRSLRPPAMDHPETELLEQGEGRTVHLHRIVPVHPATEGLSPRALRWLVWQALDRFGPAVEDPRRELMPPELPGLREAYRWLHFPDELEDAERARRRLALEEFVELQLGIQRRRRRFQRRARALPCGGDNRLIRPFLAALPFKLTEAQTRVLRELRQDLRGPHPMRRLLQGDVGCGKTVVAACCALMAVESGCEVAYMAPTEVLARQQHETLRRWFEPLGVPVELWTGSCKTDHGLFRNLPPVTVGTHALIEAGYHPERLGLVIIDEQHKFGVAQRQRLLRKGRWPHLLVMTATPIPRTLGLTLYGDLDVSVIDALPAGRGPVRTHVRTERSLPKVWDYVADRLAKGEQAYVVYPRVEESDAGSGLKAVLEEQRKLAARFAPHAVGLLHGRMSAEEKAAAIRAFREGRTRILVASSVIEVGIDVPDANLMVIENADRFGLAQLHQLRGRIGRGGRPAVCILISTARTPEARARLKVLEETTDGFRIAEADLRLRGPGELLGQAQSGLPPLRFGDLASDLDLVEQARDIAARWLDREEKKPGAGTSGG